MFSVVNFKSAEGSSRLVWHTCKQLPASCILGIKDLLCIEMVHCINDKAQLYKWKKKEVDFYVLPLLTAFDEESR